MNDKLKKIVKVVVLLAIIVIILDISVVLFTKYKQRNKRTIYNSINSFIKVNDNYYAVGSSNDNKTSKEDANLIKYNSKFKELYNKKIDLDYNSSYFSIKQDGKYLLAVGSYEKTKDEHKSGLRSALFVKYDQNGKIIFKKDYQDLGNSKFQNVLVLDDSYIVVGQSIYENSTLGNDKTGGAILIKYSKDGKELARKNIGGNKSGLFNDVIKVGNYIYAVGKDASRYGAIVKYDEDLEVVKSVTYGKTDTFGWSSITTIGDDLVVVGAKKLNEDDEYNHDTDALIVKYNTDLEVIEEKKYKETKNGIERFNKIITDNNNLIIVGHVAIEDKKKSTDKEYAYYYKSFINKYDKNLNLIKTSVYSKYQDNYFTDLKLVDNNYIVSGFYKYNDNKYKTILLRYNKDLK